MNKEKRYQQNSGIVELIVGSLTDYAIFTTDKLGTISTWNTGAEKIMLFKPEEIIRTSGDLFVHR